MEKIDRYILVRGDIVVKSRYDQIKVYMVIYENDVNMGNTKLDNLLNY